MYVLVPSAYIPTQVSDETHHAILVDSNLNIRCAVQGDRPQKMLVHILFNCFKRRLFNRSVQEQILSVVMSERGHYKAILKKIIVQCVPLDSPSCVSLS